MEGRSTVRLPIPAVVPRVPNGIVWIQHHVTWPGPTGVPPGRTPGPARSLPALPADPARFPRAPMQERAPEKGEIGARMETMHTHAPPTCVSCAKTPTNKVVSPNNPAKM